MTRLAWDIRDILACACNPSSIFRYHQIEGCQGNANTNRSPPPRNSGICRMSWLWVCGLWFSLSSVELRLGEGGAQQPPGEVPDSSSSSSWELELVCWDIVACESIFGASSFYRRTEACPNRPCRFRIRPPCSNHKTHTGADCLAEVSFFLASLTEDGLAEFASEWQEREEQYHWNLRSLFDCY